ncbi:MAG: hypothetical protein FJ026_01790, partial [Chloroflexi bacterium]|nr:hypothetical protein [Chloroflexota bacterium]
DLSPTTPHIPTPLASRFLDHLSFLYGHERAAAIWPELQQILADFRQRNPPPSSAGRPFPFSESDAVLITYGDQLQQPGTSHLQTLQQALAQIASGVFSTVHILPFFPSTSDDGFSVANHTQVDPNLGTWADIQRIGDSFRLMFDVVINHISRHSQWFQRFLAGDPEYAHWFIHMEPETPTDWIPQVVRPRALPLLTPVQTATGERLVWTTFSDDQIDLNYAHPPVLLRMVETLLQYVEKGAEVLRLDAIAYLWKKTGTPCLHLEETHRVVKLLRCVLDAVAPHVALITETNVPHEDNISYFGSGEDEAQLVYQFPLAPLVMHTLLSGSAGALSRWAAGLSTPSPHTAFFNFTASHDGIGLLPARGQLTEAQIQALIDTTLAHGGRVSWRSNADGSRSVYELNISYFDALSNPTGGEPLALQVSRFMCSQAIMLALAGLPAVYVHSLLGSRSWHEGVARSGHNRTINRQKLDLTRLQEELADPTSLRHQVYQAYRRLLLARAGEAAFHPVGGQQVLSLGDGVFALLRTSPTSDSRLLCLHNVSAVAQSLQVETGSLGLDSGSARDLLTAEESAIASGLLSLDLPPYAVRWLKLLA